ncbi:SseB family protein [Aliiroseovarius sp.]|uniref:SseB family protein n=1 Tax=Aliiroseovarius sp. TaxID=1872442 RepID=UPI0026345C1F|nr:SseB family protein [Aliiroseovarius sp.]
MTDQTSDDLTRLDAAHAGMQADLEDDAARLRFYERLADGELFLLLTREADGDSLDPELFELEGDRFVLVFDREDRLTGFTETASPYAALPGRVIAGMLAGQGIGLGVNLGVAPSSILIPAEAMGWLAETLGHGPEQVEARISEVTAPGALPEGLLIGLDAKLATAGGLARCACLVGVTYEDGRRGHLLGFIDPVTGAEPALAGAVSEALTFSGIEAGQLDVGFFASADKAGESLMRHGLRYDLPEPAAQAPSAPQPPGMDPGKPPILK